MLRICLLYLMVLFSSSILLAQKKLDNKKVSDSSQGKVSLWKRRALRLIDIRDSMDAFGHIHKRELPDTMLTKLLIEAVGNKNITAYEYPFDKVLDLDESKYSDANQDSTTIVTDTGEVTIAIDRSPHLEGIMRYRILEDWVFDPQKRETDIRILGFAPCKEVYGDDGKYRGRKSMFWLKWKDLDDMLYRSESDDIKNKILKYIWADYFKYLEVFADNQNNAQPAVEQKRIITAIRDIEIRDTDDWRENDHINISNEDWTLGQAFYDSIHKNSLAAYRNLPEPFKDKIPFDSILYQNTPDTIKNVEYIADNEWQKIVLRDVDWNDYSNYSVLEEWSFDPQKGRTKIRILGIEPRTDRSNSEHIKFRNLFWVKYDDIIDILQRYDEYHPQNGFSAELWQSYFKHETVK